MTAFSAGLRPLALALILALAACIRPEPFDALAYAETSRLQAEAGLLLDQSGPYPTDQAADLIAATEAAETAARARGDAIAAAQWEILTDPNGNLLGGVLARWQRDDTLRPAFRDEAALLVDDGFRVIACTELAKREPMACLNAGGN